MKKVVVVLTLFAAIAFGGLAYALDISDIIGVIGGGFLVETIAEPVSYTHLDVYKRQP